MGDGATIKFAVGKWMDGWSLLQSTGRRKACHALKHAHLLQTRLLWQVLHSHQAICGCAAAIVYSLMNTLQRAYGPYSWPAGARIH